MKGGAKTRQSEIKRARSPQRGFTVTSYIALALLRVAQFVMVLDFSVVGGVLPTIEEELGFSREVLLLGEVLTVAPDLHIPLGREHRSGPGFMAAG
ncbi:MAG: hypothetical protein AVDCRST_MAG28-143 [uncultured Rubrobacteraceae bacterium]|uniref:Major facilitator superfamily (MFS) profile domain-containing protein n=1 Tax=uncultured Rubrobacteraceae bacterium TaxID=349277 RepID=A0A6J4QEB4_9ACTN|nr:MAG: hypothetical protein AVDCRST_MAG28-143 [uncultured Rubrobacteraceae bacterium]